MVQKIIGGAAVGELKTRSYVLKPDGDGASLADQRI